MLALKNLKQNDDLKQKTIIFDANFRPKLWADKQIAVNWYKEFYEISDVILPSVEDEMDLFGFENIDQVLAHLTSFSDKEFVLKNGSESAVFIGGNDLINVPTFSVQNVVDTTSAGDSFNAQYIYSRFVENKMPEAAIIKAHALAGEVIRYKGALISEIFEE